MADGGYTASSTLTRAANTTPYTGNDVVGGAGTFALSGGPDSGQRMWLSQLRFTLNITALPAAMTTFDIYFYNVTPPSAIADNSPFTFGSGDRASYLGRVSGLTATLIGTGTSSVVLQYDNINIPMRLLGPNVYYYLVTQGAFTPAANSETYSGTAEFVSI